MATKGLTTAMTLYRCGTLTFSQAAARAGQNSDAFARALNQYDIPHTNEQLSAPSSATNRQLGAD